MSTDIPIMKQDVVADYERLKAQEERKKQYNREYMRRMRKEKKSEYNEYMRKRYHAKKYTDNN